jgi:hypothetical protein
MSVENSDGGIGLSMILFLIFLVLKLTGNITWSWWWVFSPFWIPVVLLLSMFFIFLIISALYLAFTGKNLSDLF